MNTNYAGGLALLGIICVCGEAIWLTRNLNILIGGAAFMLLVIVFFPWSELGPTTFKITTKDNEDDEDDEDEVE